MNKNEKIKEAVKILNQVSYMAEVLENTFIKNSVTDVKNIVTDVFSPNQKTFDDIYSEYYLKNKTRDGGFEMSFVDYLAENYTTPIKKT